MRDINGKKIRVGQRVRVTFEGVLEASEHGGLFLFLRDLGNLGVITSTGNPFRGTQIVEVLAEPRIPEPKGLGAVVEAASDYFEHLQSKRERFVRIGIWWFDTAGDQHAWGNLVDPVLLSEGWTDGDA